VFEDFYPHYGINQRHFATRWAATGNHAFVALLQREVGDVIWYAFSLAPELREARHEVVGCRVRFLPSSWVHRRLWRAFYSFAPWRRNRVRTLYTAVASYVSLASWAFVVALRKDRPDFFFVQDYASGRFDVLLVVARILGIPLVAYHSGSKPSMYQGWRAKRWSLPHADCLIASGREEWENLTRDYAVPPEHLKVILTPIDTDVYRPIERALACRASDLDPARRYVVFVGRLDVRVKRVNTLIKVFAAVAGDQPDVDLVIVGDGPDRQKLAMQAEACAPGRVRFLGWIADPEKLAHVYNAAECLILPSWSEGFPTVVGEATACGTPVLASRVGGVSELVVHGQTGWLFEAGDDEALARHLAFVTSHPDVVRSMRTGARRTAQARVSPAVVAAALKKCFSMTRTTGMSQ
jgi:glycosyltransferase involved in cell wall biosynthesis